MNTCWLLQNDLIIIHKHSACDIDPTAICKFPGGVSTGKSRSVYPDKTGYERKKGREREREREREKERERERERTRLFCPSIGSAEWMLGPKVRAKTFPFPSPFPSFLFATFPAFERKKFQFLLSVRFFQVVRTFLETRSLHVNYISNHSVMYGFA